MKRRRIWVSDCFGRKIKQIAATEDKSILEISKEIGESDILDEFVKKNRKITPKKKEGGFDFKF